VTSDSPILILPFVLLLAAMALAPMMAPKWWTKYHARIALGLGGLMAGIYLWLLHDAASVFHAAHEYFSFVILLGALFVVSGGIHIQVKGTMSPQGNIVFLLVGAILANLLGTTGAAILLIRPWMQFNRSHFQPYHLAFFIFIVANIGGCLTPIGDPPLFLGYLEGVPFWWVAQNCWPMWSMAIGLLLLIFYLLDRKRSISADELPTTAMTWSFAGGWNLIFLMLVLGAAFVGKILFLRESLMLGAAAGSYFTTPKAVHQANDFNFHPITEVAVLFAGIFATMIPALAWLDHHAASFIGQNPSAAMFYWGTGALSTVLDNAPTYLGFLSALHGVTGGQEPVASLLNDHAIQVVATSIGAVFFGAATYIGNGPNLMVKAIVEQAGVRTPSFMAFILRFALPYLLPVLIVVWAAFFR
jgi:Na+/H+ antiporter NhaD/arsenite permease-like protein